MIEEIFAGQESLATNRISGVMIGIVTNNQDPDGLGRVKVRLPFISDTDESAWARMAVPMAGRDRGLYFLPEIEDEVLVAFQYGDPNFPLVLGALWNGKDIPPAKNEGGTNDIRLIKSRSGHIIRLIDKNDGEKIEIIEKNGKSSIVLDTANKLIKIESSQDVTISAPNGTVKIDAKNVEITSSQATTIDAKSTLTGKAAQAMTLKGQTIDLN